MAPWRLSYLFDNYWWQRTGRTGRVAREQRGYTVLKRNGGAIKYAKRETRCTVLEGRKKRRRAGEGNNFKAFLNLGTV